MNVKTLLYSYRTAILMWRTGSNDRLWIKDCDKAYLLLTKLGCRVKKLHW